ncbi:MAG: guanylate kinase [Gammaproteobacteria bacterium]|nr:guanylate kinase [Gammaproteobacteria bacterium]MCP5424651.1 guanylate kinase [Gammaproteobacteria bacterium]
MTTLGLLYIISAPSGAGKTSLVKKLLDTTPGIAVSVSHTTRPPRPSEQDGVDYYFVDPPTFAALAQQGLFLEHAKVFEHDYGTSRYAVLERLRAGIDVILEIDWQGARQVRARFPKTQTIFILPPSRDALRERLQGRGQDSAAVITRRLQEAANDMSHYGEFDYLLINDEFTTALEALRAIFIANRQRRETQFARQRSLLQGLLS